MHPIFGGQLHLELPIHQKDNAWHVILDIGWIISQPFHDRVDEGAAKDLVGCAEFLLTVVEAVSPLFELIIGMCLNALVTQWAMT